MTSQKNKSVLNGYRIAFFWAISSGLVGAVTIIDHYEIADALLLYHGIIAGICMICAVMFADWWRVKGSASSIFKWITVLLFAVGINQCAQFVSHWVSLYGPCFYSELVCSRFLVWQLVPLLVAMVFLLSFAIWQRFGRGSTYHDGIRNDMANGFEKLSARIVDGEIKFLHHSHDGLVLDAKIILRNIEEGESK